MYRYFSDRLYMCHILRYRCIRISKQYVLRYYGRERYIRKPVNPYDPVVRFSIFFHFWIPREILHKMMFLNLLYR